MKRRFAKFIIFIFLLCGGVLCLSSCISYNVISYYHTKNQIKNAYSSLLNLDKSSYLTEFNHHNRNISCFMSDDETIIAYVIKYDDKVNVFLQYLFSKNNDTYLFKEILDTRINCRSYTYYYDTLKYAFDECNSFYYLYKTNIYETQEFILDNIITCDEFINLVCEKENLNLKTFDLYDIIKYFLNNSEACYIWDDLDFSDILLRLRIKPFDFFKNDNPFYACDSNGLNNFKEFFIQRNGDFKSEEDYTAYLYIDLATNKNYNVIYPYINIATFLNHENYIFTSYFLPYGNEFSYELFMGMVDYV